jgi:hypothetical protein
MARSLFSRLWLDLCSGGYGWISVQEVMAGSLFRRVMAGFCSGGYGWISVQEGDG